MRSIIQAEAGQEATSNSVNVYWLAQGLVSGAKSGAQQYDPCPRPQRTQSG